jgi:hypothetical protein
MAPISALHHDVIFNILVHIQSSRDLQAAISSAHIFHDTWKEHPVVISHAVLERESFLSEALELLGVQKSKAARLGTTGISLEV